MPIASKTRMRALVVTAACALIAALAVAPLVGAAAAAPAKTPRPALVFGGFATVQFDPALMAAYGITVEWRGTTKPTPQGGLRYKVVDGTTTLRFPLRSVIKTVGTVGLEQTATGRDLNFTDFDVKLRPAKSVLVARTGSNIGYGGPRQTLLRISPPRSSVVVRTSRLQVKSVPITLTAAGAAAFNAQFATGLPLPPFAVGQAIGALEVKTRWYYPRPRSRRS
jgi:Htaa